MTAPVTPLDPATPQGMAVADRLTRTLGRIEWEISQRVDDDRGAGGTHPRPPRPPQPPRPRPGRQEQEVA